MAKYNIGGVIFNDEASAKKAAKELKAVEYILGQLKDADENGVRGVYVKLLDQKLFSTEIGMSFLNQLRQNLLESGAFAEEDIPPVYSLDSEAFDVSSSQSQKEISPDTKIESKIADEVFENTSKKPAKASAKKASKKPKAKKEKKVLDPEAEIKRLKALNKTLIIICAALLLCVAGMFYVSTTINSPTILNYEQELIDKYSSWEQELTEREQAIREKELEQ